jgi:hypothetical protein
MRVVADNLPVDIALALLLAFLGQGILGGVGHRILALVNLHELGAFANLDNLGALVDLDNLGALVDRGNLGALVDQGSQGAFAGLPGLAFAILDSLVVFAGRDSLEAPTILDNFVELVELEQQ